MSAWFEGDGHLAAGGMSAGGSGERTHQPARQTSDARGRAEAMIGRLRLSTALVSATLAFAATGAAAQSLEVDNKVTTPLFTSTADDPNPADIEVTSDGSVEIDSGTAITVDSDNTVQIDGDIENTATSAARGVVIEGGVTTQFNTSGQITLESADDDEDPLGSDKIGVEITGPDAVTGDIVLEEGAGIRVEGDESIGIALRTDLIGSVNTDGRIDVNGLNTVGILLDGSVQGDVRIEGNVVDVTGTNASGIEVRNDISGAFFNSGFITVASPLEGFTDDPDTDSDDDLPEARGAVLIGGSIGGGFFNDGPNPAIEEDDTISSTIDANVARYGVLISPEVSSGATGDITIGVVGADDEAVGFLNRGLISADGIDENQEATAVAITGFDGNTVTVDGGLTNTGSIRSSAFNAASTGLFIGEGATVDTITNDGAIQGNAVGDDGGMARAIQIEAGATVSTLINENIITTTSTGLGANATAVEDLSGSLTTVINRGVIGATVSDGPEEDAPEDARPIALDLRAATADISVTNENQILGDVYLGAGNDTFAIVDLFEDPDADEDDDSDDDRSAFIIGSLFTGAGNDTVTIEGQGILTGGIYSDGGTVDLTVSDGEIFLPASETISVTTATLGANSVTTVFLNAENQDTARITATDLVTVEDGAQFDVQLEEFLGETADITIIDAGTLVVNGGLDLADDGDLFFLYNGTLAVSDTNINEVVLQLDLKTPGELGLNNNQTAAYPAVIEILDADDALAVAIGNIDNGEDFRDAYNQLLPDTGLPSRMAALTVTDQTAFAVSSRLDAQRRVSNPNGSTAWFQIIGAMYEQDPVEDEFGFDGETYGIAGGFDYAWLGADAIGLNFSWAGSRIEEQDSFDDEFRIDSLMLGAYASWSAGPAFLALHGHAGFNKYRSERRVRIDEDTFDRSTSADWDGHQYGGSVRVGADVNIGNTRITPVAGFDYLFLQENGFSESGGGSGVDLVVEERDSTSMRASAGVEVAHRFRQGDGHLVPKLRVGYRQELETDPLETTARFRDGTESFTLTGAELSDSGITGGVGVTYELPNIDITVGYDGLVEDNFIRHSGGLTFRFAF